MLRIFSLSDSDKHFSSAISEYKKRLGNKIKIINIKPEKYGTHKQIIEKETKKIIEKIKKEQKKGKSRKYILLSKEGNTHTTEQFTQIFKKHLDITFIIGGPYGLNEKELQTLIQKKISFGKHTMPHGLVKLVLIEQIYRSNMIESSKAYHR